jgi:hypothetical protein
MTGLFKKLVIFGLAMVLVAAVGWFGRKAYRATVEHRLIAQAALFSKTNDFRNAELCLRRALQVNPLSVPAISMVADMLEMSGSRSAVGWRARVVQLGPENTTNRLEWAETALKFGELKSADQALSELRGPARGLAVYHKLAGALAWSRHNAAEAEADYLAALGMEPTNEVVLMNLDTVRLGSTNREVAQAARRSLENLVSSPAHRINALHLLEQDSADRKAWPDALMFSKQLVVEPTAGFADKLTHLQLLKLCTNAQFPQWLTSVKMEATNSPSKAFAFGRWMAGTEGPSAALSWLHELPAVLQTNQPVPLIITDCQIALKDWRGLLATIQKKDLGLDSTEYRGPGKDNLRVSG